MIIDFIILWPAPSWVIKCTELGFGQGAEAEKGEKTEHPWYAAGVVYLLLA